MQKEVALLTICKKPFEKELALALLEQRLTVYVLGHCELNGVHVLEENARKAYEQLKESNITVDLYIENADEQVNGDDFHIRDGINEDILIKSFRANVSDCMSRLETFLPLMKKSEKKRLCFLSTKEATVSGSTRTSGYGYAVSKGAFHNFLQMARNKLAPLGYTLRIYDPMTGVIDPQSAAAGAVHLFLRDRAMDPVLSIRDDEKRLKLRDAEGREHAW